MWTEKHQEAVEFSFLAHEGQKRKNSGISYIAHPMTVGIILASQGCDSDLITAGILHDIIEDTTFKKDDLEKRFGQRVADLVESVTETDRDLPWKERKERVAAHLWMVNEDVLLLKAADILSNMTDLLLALKRDGEKAFDIFHAEKSEKIKQIERWIKIIIARGKNQEINNLLVETINKIKEYED